MKIFKIILINTILFVLIFFIFDVAVYYRHIYMSHKYNPLYSNLSYFKHIFRKMSSKYIQAIMFDKNNYKKPLDLSNSDLKESIILFGCSFVEGAALKNNENFQYNIASVAKMPVFDRSSGGWGTQHMLYQASNDLFYEQIQSKPKYIIYTYITDHINRIHIAMDPVMFGGYPTFIYSKSLFNNKLKITKLSEIILRFPISSHIKQTLFFLLSKEKERADFLKRHILQTKTEINKRYPEAEFIVFAYNFNNELLLIADDLRQNGIKTLYFSEITGMNPDDEQLILSKYDSHPNAKAWTIVVPKLWNYITNYNQDIEQNIKQFEKHSYIRDINRNISFKQAFFMRDFPSGFSICLKDNLLIENKECTKIKASIAYVLWACGNLCESVKLNFPAKIFIKCSMKINKNNDFYSKYYERLK